MVVNVFRIGVHEPDCEGNEVMMDLLAAFAKRRNGEPPEVVRRKVCGSCLENVSTLLSTALNDIGELP